MFHQAFIAVGVINSPTLRSASAPVLGALGDTRDKALRAMDSGMDMVFIATFGRPGALLAFVTLALLTSYLAYARAMAGTRFGTMPRRPALSVRSAARSPTWSRSFQADVLGSNGSASLIF